MMVYTNTSYRPRSRKRKPLPKKPRKEKQPFQEYKPVSTSFVKETPQYESVDTGVHFTGKVEPQKYTGSLVKGIATMHKSNAVPVIDQEYAKQLASMRR